MSHTLSVQLVDARNLKPVDRPCQAYARVKLGSTERKSSISPKGTQNPYWCEEFSFEVDDLGAELSVSIWSRDRLSDVFHGRIRLPVAVILYAERQAIPSSWYPLCSKSKTPTPGEVRVSFSLSKRRSCEDEGSVLLSFFEDDGTSVPSSLEDMPTPLGGGVLLSHTYPVSVKVLNRILFRPGSHFLKDLNELQKTTNLVETPWIEGEDNLPKRVITYVKAATKLIRSVKATEEQKYSRADEKGFVVDVSAITPDAPCGSTFKVNLQYCIFAGSNTSTGERTSLLRVSWGLQFLTSTMMKGVIEKGARQGLEESYKQYAQVLKKSLLIGGEVQNEESIEQKSSVDVARKSDWQQLAREYFCSIRVWITLLSIFLVLAHIFRRSPSKSGLQGWKLDLPQTLLSALLGAQIQSVIGMARKLLRGRLHNDH